jgi:hypothetical protein
MACVCDIRCQKVNTMVTNCKKLLLAGASLDDSRDGDNSTYLTL